MSRPIDATTVEFDGLGLEAFTMDKVFVSLFDGKLEIRWYGVLITLGIICAFLYTAWRGKRNERIVVDDVIDIALVTVVCGVVGARLYYVLTTLDTGRYESFGRDCHLERWTCHLRRYHRRMLWNLVDLSSQEDQVEKAV